MRHRKVDDEIKSQPICLIEARLGEVLRRGCKHDRDARELLFESLLHIVIVCAAADAGALHTDGFLENLDRQESQYERLLRRDRLAVRQNEAGLDSEFVD